MLLGGVTLPTGQAASVRLDAGRIAAVGPAGSLPPAPPAGRADLTGYLLLPAPAEPHAHLDKALTAARAPNAAGDLPGAVDAWLRYRAGMSREDAARRALQAALMGLASGATAIRTHVDVGSGVGLRGLEALVEVREALRGRLALQLVASVDAPLTGAAGAEHRALLRAALQMGADAVGGYPNLDPDPAACLETCLAVAAEHGRPVDLHLDETLDPGVLWLAHLADLVARSGFPHAVTASHCVSLGVQPPKVAARVAEQAAAAGIAVVCLPQTNLFLQARGYRSAPPRGLTALRALLDAGVTVAAGGDNLQDPFNPMGRGDPLETASLLVTAGHLTVAEAYAAVSAAARAAMGLPPVQLAAGFPAELLAIRAASLEEAVAMAPSERVVVHQGRVVSRTAVTRELVHPVPPATAAPSHALR